MLWILIFGFILGYLWYTDHLNAVLLIIKEIYDWISFIIASHDWTEVKAFLFIVQEKVTAFFVFTYNYILTHPQESKGFFIGIVSMYLLLKITHWFHSPKVVIKHR